MSVLFANVFLSTTLRVLWLEQKPFSSAFPCLCSCIQSGQSNLSRVQILLHTYMNDCTEIPLTGFLISHAYSVNFFAQSNFWSKLFWMDAISISIDPKSFITGIKFPTTDPWITRLISQLGQSIASTIFIYLILNCSILLLLPNLYAYKNNLHVQFILNRFEYFMYKIYCIYTTSNS